MLFRSRVPMYGEGTEIGFYGDFQQQPFERSGPLPVVAAKEFGAGRIVVIGDQNALGGIFINYADNRKLWLQAVNWTLQRETKREADLVKGLAADPDRSLIWCLEPLEDHRYLWGSSDPNKFYNAFGLFNKHADARGTDRDLFEADWMLIADAKLLEREPWIGKLKKFLDGPKKQAVVWMDVDIDDNDKWTEGILKGQAIASMKDGKVLSFSLPNGSKLHLRPDIEAWTNKKLTGPESTRDEAVLKAEDAILNFFWSQGMKKVPSIEESVQWPDGGR